MLFVYMVLFVGVLFLLWKVAVASARMNRRAYGLKARPPVQQQWVYGHLSGEGRGNEVTTIVNVYPDRDQVSHSALASDGVRQGYSQPYEAGYPDFRE